MHRLKRLLRRLFAPFQRRQLERDIAEEFRLHIEMETEQRVRAGLAPAEARRVALRDFGGLERFSDDARATRGALWFDHITRDLRHGLRALGRAPAFSAVAILTLALGIGANTAMFSVVNGVLLRPLPYQDPDKVVLVWRASPERGLDELKVGFGDYREWRTSTRQFSDLAVWNLSSVTIQGRADPERILTQFASANLLPMLGVQAVLGRFFTAHEEEHKEHVAVISHSLWQRRFAGRADVLGESLELSGDGDAWKRGPRTVRVVGVLPADFYFPNRRVDVWEPAATYWRFDREDSDRAMTAWNVAARLQRNASVASARAELRTITQRLEAARPVTRGSPASDVRVVPMLDYVTGKGMQYTIWILLGAVSLVLLIACANVANLLLARGAARERELATRTALGASRGRVLAQLLAETAALVAIAVAPAVAVAGVAVRALTKFAPAGLPRIDEIRVDGNVLLFTILVAVLTGVAFGLAPAWKLSRTDPRDALSESGRTAGGLRLGRVRSLLVVSECALAIALLACSGLLIRSMEHVRSVELGYNPDHVLLMRVGWPPGLQGVETSETWGRELVERVKALPGVEAAATSIGFMRGGPDALIVIENQPTPEVQVAIDGVGPGFFETVGTPILRGREPDWSEMSSAARLTGQQPAVINQTLARTFFGETDPIGKRIRVGKTWVLTVTGIAGDMRRESPERPPVPQIFFGAVSFQVNDLLVRTSGDPLALAPAIRDIIRNNAATAVILSSTTLSATVDALTAERRFQTWLLALFAMLALILAVIGVYGVVHYAVAQRMRELSIRMAMGARASDVLTMVVKQGLRLAALGSTIGVLAALGLSRLIAHQLFGVASTDPVTYIGVIALLLTTALLACVVPAARAARLAPALVLKGE